MNGAAGLHDASASSLVNTGTNGQPVLLAEGTDVHGVLFEYSDTWLTVEKLRSCKQELLPQN